MTGSRFVLITSARQSGSLRSSSGGTMGTVFVVVADDDGPAQLRDVAERLRVGNAGQEDLGPGQRPDSRRAVLAPPLRELAPGMGHGHDQDALAGAVGEHRRQVDGTDDGKFVQGLQQRLGQPAWEGQGPASRRSSAARTRTRGTAESAASPYRRWLPGRPTRCSSGTGSGQSPRPGRAWPRRTAWESSPRTGSARLSSGRYPAVRLVSNTRRATASISGELSGCLPSTSRAVSWPWSWFQRNTSVMLYPPTAAAHRRAE